MGSVVRATLVLNAFWASLFGEVDLDMTVFMAVTLGCSEISHFGGSTALIIVGGLDGDETGALLVLESCLLLHEPVEEINRLAY